MANGGMFVLRNFYVSFCQNFKGELLSRQQRPHTAGLREDIQLITDSSHSPAVLMQDCREGNRFSWEVLKWIKNVDSYTHVEV